LNNLTLLGLLIIFLWLVAYGYYFYVSRKQRDISAEIDELRDELDKLDKQPEEKTNQG
jgi:preprotein translocase subunit YajC